MRNCKSDTANLVLPGGVEPVLGQELEQVEGQRLQMWRMEI